MVNREVISCLLVILFLPVVLLGQERTNREKINFVKISKPLEKAKGWEYNETFGKWIDYNNVISQNTRYKEGIYRLEKGRFMMSNYSQNFIKIQTKSVIYKETEYFVLVIEKWEGEIVDIDVHESQWRSYRQTDGYIFSKEEYQKLHNIENLVELKTKYMVSIGESEKYNEAKFLALIQTALEAGKSEGSFEYIFPVLKSTEGAIRFYLPEHSSSNSKYNFDKKYFETSLKNFSKIIIR